MSIRLKPDVQLATGSTFAPVDLVSRSTLQRLPLSSEEAAVAMLLIEGTADLSSLLELADQNDVHWDLARAEAFVQRLAITGLLEPAAPLFDDGATVVSGGALEEEETFSIRPTAENLEAICDADLLEIEPADELADELEGESRAGWTEHTEPSMSRPAAPTPLPAPPPRPSRVVSPEAAPPRTEPAAPGREQVRPLATAATMVCERRHTEAKALLLAVLEQEPENLQARAMLELVETQLRPAPRSARGLWIFLLTLLALLTSAGLAGWLLKVPRRVQLPCRTSSIALPPVTAPIDGLLARVEARAGQLVSPGQVLAEIKNEGGARELAGLREQLESDLEQLRIMRTGGTDADVKLLKQRQATLLAARRRARGSELEVVNRRLEANRVKLRFCEWQALAREVSEMAAKVSASEARVKSLENSLSARVICPVEGWVKSIAVSSTPVRQGQPLASLLHPGLMTAEAQIEAPGLARGERVQVMVGTRSSQLLLEQAAGPGPLKLTIEGSPELAEQGPTCTLVTRLGKTPLLRALLDRFQE